MHAGDLCPSCALPMLCLCRSCALPVLCLCPDCALPVLWLHHYARHAMMMMRKRMTMMRMMLVMMRMTIMLQIRLNTISFYNRHSTVIPQSRHEKGTSKEQA